MFLYFPQPSVTSSLISTNILLIIVLPDSVNLPVTCKNKSDTPCQASVVIVQCCMQHCTQYHLCMAVSWENALRLVQQNRDTAR